MSVPSGDGGDPNRYNITQLMQWGKALVDSNRAHRPLPTTMEHVRPNSASEGAERAATPHSVAAAPLATRPTGIESTVSHRVASPVDVVQPRAAPTAPQRSSSFGAHSRTNPSINTSSRPPSRASTPARTATPTATAGTDAGGAEPPASHASSRVVASAGHASRRPSVGTTIGSGPQPEDRHLVVPPGANTAAPGLANVPNYSFGGASVATDSPSVFGAPPSHSTGQLSMPRSPTTNAAVPLPSASLPAPWASSSRDRPNPGAVSRAAPTAASIGVSVDAWDRTGTQRSTGRSATLPRAADSAEVMTQLTALQQQLQQLEDDERSCGRCVAAISAAATFGSDEQGQVLDNAAEVIAGLPSLASTIKELSAVAAKMACQSRPAEATFRTPLPTPPSRSLLSSLSRSAAIAAAKDSIVDFCDVSAAHLREVETSFTRSLDVLIRTTSEATRENEEQRKVIDTAHATLGGLSDELEGLQAECTDLGLHVAARKRRVEEVANEAHGRHVHIAALKRTARDASSQAEQLRQQHQHDHASAVASSHAAVALRSEADAIAEKRAAMIAQEKHVRAVEAEHIAEHEGADRNLRLLHSELEDKHRDLKVAAALRDETAQHASRVAAEVAQLREALDAVETQLRVAKRDDQAAKEQLRAVSGQVDRAVAEAEALHAQRAASERENIDLEAALEEAERRASAELARQTEAEVKVDVLELALHRIASRQHASAPPLTSSSAPDVHRFSAVAPSSSVDGAASTPGHMRLASRRSSASDAALAAHIMSPPSPQAPRNIVQGDESDRSASPAASLQAIAIDMPVPTALDASRRQLSPGHEKSRPERGAGVSYQLPTSAAHTNTHQAASQRKHQWKSVPAADRPYVVADADTPASTVIGDAIDLPMSPERGPLTVTMQPRLLRGHYATDDAFHGGIATAGRGDVSPHLPRVPSLLRGHIAGRPPLAGGGVALTDRVVTPASFVSDSGRDSSPMPVNVRQQAAGLVHRRPVAGPHPLAADDNVTAYNPEGTSPNSSVYSAPDVDEDMAPTQVPRSFPSAPTRAVAGGGGGGPSRKGAPPAVLQDEFPPFEERRGGSVASSAGGGGGASSNASSMAAIEARLKSVLARRTGSSPSTNHGGR